MNKIMLWLLIVISILPMTGCGGNTSLTEKENRVILGNEQFDAYVP